MRKFLKNENGEAVIVEATLVLPFCIIMVIALYYAAIFLCQKANLQANVENSLIYYKNTVTDTYVQASDNMAYASSKGTVSAVGSSMRNVTYEQPYRFLGMKFDKAKFASFFHSMAGYMFFDDGTNIEITSSVKNYVIYKEITATAKQTVQPAIKLSVVGGSDSLDIVCTSSVVISDGDEFIRNTDFAIDLVKETKVGEMAGQMVDKVAGFYNKFKEKFGI